MRTLKNKQNQHEGSDFDSFLREEGMLERCEEKAAKSIFVMQLESVFCIMDKIYPC